MIGEPFTITKFESPALMVPEHIPSVELSLTQNHLVLTLEQVSGSIWMLEDVSQYVRKRLALYGVEFRP